MCDDGNRDDWSPAEQEALDALPRESRPAPELEQRVVDALHDRGLLRPRSSRSRALAGIATAVLAFTLGIAGDRWLLARSAGAAAPDGEPSHVLMLYRPRELSNAGSDLPSRADEYANWARDQAAVVGGEELEDDGEWLMATRVARDENPTAERTLVGYFIVRAADDEAARAVASTCPHLERGSIELRRIRRR